ncbi:hypothetical protein RugamoR64_57780 [Duganella rhizosphaerae]|uniref:hypothetical protein n=1 Tax=Duganella rhizosphaerae TaxID=2885763 RepID=UPI0030EB0A67
MKPELHIASNGFLSLDSGDDDSALAMSISLFLETDWGFRRQGPAVLGVDEGISPNFVRGEIVLAAGWDNWSGQYLLSNSKDGDEILRQIFSMILPSNEFKKQS